MKIPFLAVAALAGLSLSAPGQILINEIDSDVVGNLEFVELYDGGVGNTSLSGHVLVLINGTGDAVYNAFDLTGQSTDANGFFVIGDTDVTTINLSWGTASLQNGPDAVGLYADTLGAFPNGAAATDTNLVDAIVYSAGTTTDAALAALLTPGFGTVNEDANFNEDFDSLARRPDGGTARDTSTYLAGPPTPGASNGPANALTLSLGAFTISESEPGAAPILATVTRSDTSGGDLTVTIFIDDETEANADPSVTITGTNASAQFSIFAFDDLFPDGDQTVEVSVAAAATSGDSQTFTVTDDPGDTYSLIINEAHAAPGAATGDINGDGTANNDDEFIEIVNVTGATIDLTGFTVRDRFNQTHAFRAGTRLDPGCALLVFSGQGNLELGTTAAFGNAEVQVASSGMTLRLTNSGDDIAIVNDMGFELYSMTYGDLTGLEANGSLNLNTDKDASTGYAQHALIAGAVGNFSPGLFLDGVTQFCTVTQALTVAITPGSVAETAGPGAASAQITIPAALGFDLEVALVGNDDSEALSGDPDTTTIPMGSTSVNVPIDAVDDVLVDGPQTVTFSGIASGYLNGTDTLEVTDAGDVPTFTDLVINEVDADTPGTDAAEFIELFNLTGTASLMDGLVLVLINGNGDTVYNAIDLAGFTIPANGYFVIGNSAGADTNGGLAATNAIQNGADAVALYVGSLADFPDGKTAASITNTLVDSLVYGVNDPDDADLIAIYGGPQVEENANGLKDTESMSRLPDGTGAFAVQTATPGASNFVAPTVGPDIVFIFPNFPAQVIMNIANLSPGVTYALQSSVDAGDPTAFAPVADTPTFTTADGVAGPGGVFQFGFADSSIGTKPTNIYRVQAP